MGQGMVNRAFGKPTAKVFPLIPDEMVASYPAHPSLGLTRGVARVPVAQLVTTITPPLAISVGSPAGKKNLENKILQLEAKAKNIIKKIEYRSKIYGENWDEIGDGKKLSDRFKEIELQFKDLKNQLDNYDL